MGRGCFYTAEPDPNSKFDSYDPTRECFNIDGAVATTDDTEDAATGARAPTAREDPRTPGNDGQADPPPQVDKAAQLAQLQELKAKLDEDRECLSQLEWALERDQPHPYGRGARGRARDVYRKIVGDKEPEPLVSRSLELVRTSWQQPCCYATCLSPRTPRHDAFKMRCKVCSTWRQPSKPRAQPLEVEG